MRVGIIGGGQLGMYLVDAAHCLNHTTIVLDPSLDGPATQNSDEYICGDYDDPTCLKQLAMKSDVITYEFENVKASVIDYLTDNFDVLIPQGKNPLLISQHRIREKRSLNQVGIKTAEFSEILNKDDLEKLKQERKYPYIIKTCSGGYDGKGQWMIQSDEDFEGFKQDYQESIEYIKEAMVDFACEISIIAIRNAEGKIVTYDAIENIHQNGILHLSISPARIDEKIQSKAKQVASDMMEKLDFIGIVAVEMFVGKDGNIYVNEIAPRPHNSGHLTMDSYTPSQYENAIAAITSGAIKEPHRNSDSVMVNILGQHLDQVMKHSLPEHAKLYLYGKKESKVNRKMGHITFTGKGLEEMIQEAKAALK
ncbi:MAG: 5-(carboxyamino)imidazole ribonucleotide synthase [Erysipelotrichaceae bacterium]